ncbi:MAG: hypothetical protein GY913_24730 [Proteobacteria bacterium]|nr:hypothetical protein [Pseudomonadota bacterium]MCP4920121.1 hypothetical protein [Pseudomonadota bacterium]
MIGLLMALMAPSEAANPWSVETQPLLGRIEYAPYWDPVLSASLYRTSAGGSRIAANLGAEVGLALNDLETILGGKTRLRGVVILPGGYDVRGGTFVGPIQPKYSLLTGADVFYNKFSVTEATPGVDFPVVFTLGPPNAYLLGGVTTTWVLNPARRVDWDRTLHRGFGHEFEYRAGFMLNTGNFHFGVAWTRRILAAGGTTVVNDGFGLTLGF